MEITLLPLLSLLILLLIACGIYLLSKKVKLPYTVLLVAAGLLLVPLSDFQTLTFITTFKLTPELLFYIFLPALIFESAYNMDIRHLVQNIRSISLLAVVGLLFSTFFVGYGIYWLFPFLGYEIPLLAALLFGALISSTDPVAVLALFKEYGAPKRLSLIFEGESLLNDGTAVAVFLIMLQIALVGFTGVGTVIQGVFMFLTMVIGGVFFGIVLGGLFSKAIGYARKYESISIALTIVAAHITYILTEFISSHLVIGGVEIRLSSIIATMAASMVIGNYGRYKMDVRAQEFVDKFWAQIAFLANSVVFLLIGLLFSDLPFSFLSFIIPIVGAIFIVMCARALSVYLPLSFLNAQKTEDHIPASWQHLLAWGSLRGALAITLVLIIPDTLTFPGWQFIFTPKEFILALTIGCIYTTLFVKATTIGPMMKKLKITDLSDIEEREYAEGRALIHSTVLRRLRSFWEKGYVDDLTYAKFKEKHENAYKKFVELESIDASAQLGERVLLIYAIGIEKHFLKELLLYSEVTEKVFKRIMVKLTIQLEKAERGEEALDASIDRDPKDIFETLARLVRRIISPKSAHDTIEEKFMYYRAQSIIARKVVKEMREAEKTYGRDVFNAQAVSAVIAKYEQFKEQAQTKMHKVSEDNPEAIHKLHLKLAQNGIAEVEESVLEDLKKREMLTPKLYITLRDELEKESEVVRQA